MIRSTTFQEKVYYCKIVGRYVHLTIVDRCCWYDPYQRVGGLRNADVIVLYIQLQVSTVKPISVICYGEETRPWTLNPGCVFPYHSFIWEQLAKWSNENASSRNRSKFLGNQFWISYVLEALTQRVCSEWWPGRLVREFEK